MPASPVMSNMSNSSNNKSSGSEGDGGAPVVDERRRKRRLSNRESARRSRMRKQQHLDELVGELTRLKTENARIATQVEAVGERLIGIDSENAVLRAQHAELTERLRYMNSMLRAAAMEIPDATPADPMFRRPWTMPATMMMHQNAAAMPIMASAETFQF